jgi:hypothetical protein
VKYSTGSAFRQALELRLRQHSQREGAPLVRLRKIVAFDRLLARLTASEPDAWVLKGGFALQVRLMTRARTTRDIDLLLTSPADDVHELLLHAASLDLGDWTSFEVGAPSQSNVDERDSVRSHVQALIDGRLFEAFHVDIGVSDVLVTPPERLTLPPLLEFAAIAPTTVQCYPLTQQIAEKVHAYSQVYASGESTRVKDLVDILLIAGLSGGMHATDLRKALEATFAQRATRLPQVLGEPPTSWSKSFRLMAEEVELESTSLDDAVERAKAFLDPILQVKVERKRVWQVSEWRWMI